MDLTQVLLKERRLLATASWIIFVWCSASVTEAQSRYARSDNMSGYVHWIDLYDSDNRKIDPSAEGAKPYSPEKTCGRCHDFETISHGWHFDAAFSSAEQPAGRPGQPWVWNDERTGTHLPLSYRGWKGTHNPDELGISRWEVAAKFGGYLPGGGPGSEQALQAGPQGLEGDRSAVTGPLPVDCLMCHHNSGSGYSPFAWTEQIEDQNFAYAPSVALGIATVSGNMSRLKVDFDFEAEDASSKLPKLTYDTSRFRGDGKLFVDLVRKPKSDACYYCHTNMSVEAVNGTRWQHDEDVHLLAGMQCADCHRNGIDHEIARGFELHGTVGHSVSEDIDTEAGREEGVKSPRSSLASLSCRGCHLGPQSLGDGVSMVDLAGKLGSPRPAHVGIPPVHFEKMSCTACHSGPPIGDEVGRQVNSIAHELGKHVKREGLEAPGILAGVHLRVTDAASDSSKEVDRKYRPHRMMWPSYWGLRKDEAIIPLSPEVAYGLVRRPLKVRRDFEKDLTAVKLPLSKRRELIGEDRARLKPEDWTEEETQKIQDAENEARKAQVKERMVAALEAISKEYPDQQPVFVSGGKVFALNDEQTDLTEIEESGDAAKPYAWPLAHNVRPAQQSLGVKGCAECHSEGASYFNAVITPIATLPGQDVDSLVASELQQVDVQQLQLWNELFRGRSLFKILGLAALTLTAGVVVFSMCSGIARIGKR